LLHTNPITQRNLYSENFNTQTYLQIDIFKKNIFTKRIFTNKIFQTQKFLYRRNFYIEKILYKNTFIYINFYTEISLYKEIFTHRTFYTQKLSHKEFVIQKKLHAEFFFTHKFLYQKSLYRGAFTRHGKLKLATILWEKSSQELSGTNLPHLFQEKNHNSIIPWIYSKKYKEYISEAANPQSIIFKSTLW
jgi:hypothetical protein